MTRRYFYFHNGRYGEGREDLPELADQEVLVETTRSLVSVGTETACNTGASGWAVGRHGYSNVGIVTRMGGSISEAGDVSSGDRVFSAEIHTDRYHSPPDKLYVLPDDVTDEQAAFISLGAVAVHVVERAEIKMGQPVVVVGQGTVGQIVQQLARLAGGGRIVGVDLDAGRRDLALAFGADAAVPPDAGVLAEALAAPFRHAPPPVFMEVTASAKAAEWIFDTAPLHARVVLASAYTAACSFDPNLIVRKELMVIGAHQPKCPQRPVPYYPYSRELNYTFILEQIRSGGLKVDELYDALITPEQLLDFYGAVERGRRDLRQPIIKWRT